MNTHESYVSLETAKMLKEAGFDWKCFYSTNGIWQPSLYVAQRWLREVKGIHITVKADAASIDCKYFVTIVISDTKWGNVQDENKKTILFNTYEEAQEAGIQKCLTILLEDRL